MNYVPSVPPRCSAGPAPLRVPGSVRRTSSIDVSWPEGQGKNLRMVARARDIGTPKIGTPKSGMPKSGTPKSGGAPVVYAEDSFEALLQPDRTILAIETELVRPALSRLVGGRGGGGLRKMLEEIAPEERRNATPLYLILDDISGVSLVAGWAWSQWDPEWLSAASEALTGIDLEEAMRSREGVCVGFAPGSSGLSLKTDRSGTRTQDLRHPDDPEGWHAFTDQAGHAGLRRARRIDVSQDDKVIAIDSAFQDSATTPDGGRAVVHEYRLSARVDPQSLRLLSITAEPRVLPFVECPSATANLTKLVDTPLPELREKVLAELRGTAGCTHLNDALRALADVPRLIGHLNDLDAR